jgi:hypothetical protein
MTSATKLNALEKSHLVALVKEEPLAEATNGDFKALKRLVKLGYICLYSVSPLPAQYIATPEGKNFCRKSANMFTKAQVANLRHRIARGKYWVPKVGELIYTDTKFSIDHGYDDVEGGLSQVTRVYHDMSGGDPKCVFVEIAQHDRGGNWTQFLYPDQKMLMKEFGTQVSHLDPDYA